MSAGSRISAEIRLSGKHRNSRKRVENAFKYRQIMSGDCLDTDNSGSPGFSQRHKDSPPSLNMRPAVSIINKAMRCETKSLFIQLDLLVTIKSVFCVNREFQWVQDPRSTKSLATFFQKVKIRSVRAILKTSNNGTTYNHMTYLIRSDGAPVTLLNSCTRTRFRKIVLCLTLTFVCPFLGIEIDFRLCSPLHLVLI